MVLRNFVTLQPDTPALLHLEDHELVRRDLTDPVTGIEKTVNVLEFQVDRLDGAEVQAVLSVTSEKFAAAFEPLLPGRRYRDFDWLVTKSGSGFQTEYQVQSRPRAPEAP